jgi:hypothetical protein
MRNSFDHYRTAYTIVNAEQVPAYTIQNEGIPCFVQDATVEIVEYYKTRRERVKAVIYFVDGKVYNAIDVADRIVTGGSNYRVINKLNLCSFDTVFRIDLEEELATTGD